MARLGIAAMFCLALALALPAQGPSAARPKCEGKPATIVGSPSANALNGTRHRDVIVGLGGGDTINGRGGNDLICGGNGADKVKGGDDEDDLHGQKGNDDLFGGDGFDDLFGEQGFDALDGGRDNDKLHGGGDRDHLSGGRDADSLFGDDDNDSLFGEQGDDGLVGHVGDDKLFGGPDNDVLFGGPDSDLCDKGPGPVNETVVDCEADLSVDVSGPLTAPPGLIAFTAKVTNQGPSPVTGYTLVIASDNSHLQCDSQGFSDGSVPGVALGKGESAIHSFPVNCVVEGDPPRTVFLQASATATPIDPVPGNGSDLHTTTVE